MPRPKIYRTCMPVIKIKEEPEIKEDIVAVQAEELPPPPPKKKTLSMSDIILPSIPKRKEKKTKPNNRIKLIL